MAASPSNLKTSYHVRSISFPSRSHSPTLGVEEQLCRLRSSGTTSCSSSSSNHLSGLNELYDSVEDLLKSSVSQKAISCGRSNKCVEEILDGYLCLLDICTTTREVFEQIRECVHDVQSALRRKKPTDIADEARLYMIARKKVNKLVQKCLGDVKKAMSKNGCKAVAEKDQNLVAILSVLREVESITLSTFKSLLPSSASSRSLTKTTGWSLVSKLMQKKRVDCEGEEVNTFEIEKVDAALSTLINNKSSKGLPIESVQKVLESTLLSVQDLEDGFECIYRSLIKTRVSLLNILSQ